MRIAVAVGNGDDFFDRFALLLDERDHLFVAQFLDRCRRSDERFVSIGYARIRSVTEVVCPLRRMFGR